ncbi:MAG: FAD-dependent oxidoreductase [Deltaproteobacteria bacterium]|nr:FAD-dependent oxidoreductase [Deltaproteobacteria bacterium]
MTRVSAASASADLTAEVLVVGGGLAGLSAAIEARRAGRDVLLLCKGKAGRSGNSLVAAGNLSGVHPGIGDDEEAFVRDTLAGGRGIGSPALVRALAKGSREVVPFLEACGVVFARPGGDLACGRIPGHSRRRTVSAGQAQRPVASAGLALTLPLLREAKRLGTRILEGAAAVEVERRDGRASGVVALTPEGLLRVGAGSIVLACGGGTRVYARTNNAPDATGDGLLLAWEVGAELRDLEFVQFYPTMGLSPLRAVFSTTLFGEGAVLRTRQGERFLLGTVPGGEVAATRDEMSRAILAEVSRGGGVGGGVLLDLSGVSPEAGAEWGGGLWRALARRGWDVRKDPVIVGPCAHFLMGGVTLDDRGATTVPGLFAAGELTGGVHGANRLGGNALTEAVVFGRIAGRAAAADVGRVASSSCCAARALPTGEGDVVLREVRREVRALTWEHAGLVRSAEGLREGLERWRAVNDRWSALDRGGVTRAAFEVRCLLTVSRLILGSALARTESRGAHWRSDAPAADDAQWRGSLRVLPRDGGEPELRYVPAD